MAHSYTPGLKVTDDALVRRRRLLPIKGDVLVRAGDAVTADQVVAQTHLPGKVHTVNVVNALSITPAEIRRFMRVKEGDSVEKDAVLAENKPFLAFLKTSVRAPVSGKVENVSEVTGQVMLREPPKPLELKAYLDGTVAEVLPGEGVVVEASGAFVQGIFGVGPETHGEIVLAVQSAQEELSGSLLTEAHRGKVVVGGSLVKADAFERARTLGVRALVVGGMDDADLRRLLGYDLGVAITGGEPIGFTLVLTEGFGRIAMADRTFTLLRSKQGRRASVSGATQIRAGVMRPEIVIPGARVAAKAVKASEGLQVGDPVRVIRQPLFGRIGKVKSLPPSLTAIPTEAHVRVLEVAFDDGSSAVVPRANIEVLES